MHHPCPAVLQKPRLIGATFPSQGFTWTWFRMKINIWVLTESSVGICINRRHCAGFYYYRYPVVFVLSQLVLQVSVIQFSIRLFVHWWKFMNSNPHWKVSILTKACFESRLDTNIIFIWRMFNKYSLGVNLLWLKIIRVNLLANSRYKLPVDCSFYFLTLASLQPGLCITIISCAFRAVVPYLSTKCPHCV